MAIARERAAKGEGRRVVAHGDVVERPRRDGRRDVEKVVHVAQVRQPLVMEDRVELRRQGRPERRRGAGAVVVLYTRHGRAGYPVEHVAAGVGRHIRRAAADQRVGVRCRRREAEGALV